MAGSQERYRAMGDAQLESLLFAIQQPGASQADAGLIIAEVKRRDRAFQADQLAKQLEIATKQEQTAANSAKAARWAALIAGAALVWQLISHLPNY